MLGSQMRIAFDFDGAISFLNSGVEFAVTRFLKVVQVFSVCCSVVRGCISLCL